MQRKRSIKEKKVFSDFDFKDYFIFIFLIIIMILVPLIVKLEKTTSSDAEVSILGLSPQLEDVFAYVKSQVLIISSVIVLFCYGCYYFINLDKIDFKNYKSYLKQPFIIAFIIFGLMILLSTIFSEYRQVAIFGVYARYEGILILFSYFLIFFATFDFCRGKFQTKLVLYILTGSAFLIGLIGAGQAFGYDFFNTELAAKLVQGKYYQGNRLIAIFTQSYATLYNPNSVGLYTTFIFPILFFAGIFYPVKSIFKYILLSVSLLMLICLLGSNSAGGFVGLAFASCSAFIFGIIYILKYRENLNKKLYMYIVTFLVLGLAIFMLPNVQTKIKGVYTKFTTSSYETKNMFTDWKVEDNYSNIYMHEDYIHIWYNKDSKQISLSLNGGKEIEPVSIQKDAKNPLLKKLTYELPNFGVATIDFFDNIFVFSKDGIDFYFETLSDGTLTAVTKGGGNMI